MSKHHKISKVLFLSTLLFSVYITPARAIDDAIIAVVNDEVIALKDLRDYVHSTYVSMAARGISDSEMKKIMADLEENGMRFLIEDKLILSKANSLGLIVNDEILNEKVDEIKRKYGSEQEFLDALILHRASITELRDRILNQLKIDYVIDFEIKSKIFINPQEVTNFYERNPDEFMLKERVDLDSIFIMFKGEESREKMKAEEALKLIKEGQEFKKVAGEYSDTPSIGRIEKGQILPVIEQAVFSMKEGEVSGIIEGDNGLYILKVLKKFPAQVAGLDEVSDPIRQLLFKQKFKKRYREWMDELKEDAYIEIKQ